MCPSEGVSTARSSSDMYTIGLTSTAICSQRMWGSADQGYQLTELLDHVDEELADDRLVVRVHEAEGFAPSRISMFTTDVSVPGDDHPRAATSLDLRSSLASSTRRTPSPAGLIRRTRRLCDRSG